MNPQFVVLGAFNSQSSRTFFHVFPELSRSIVNAVPGEISDWDESAWNSRINDKANRPFPERELYRKYVPDRAQAVDRGSLLFGEARGKRLSFDTWLRGTGRKPLVFAASRKEM